MSGFYVKKNYKNNNIKFIYSKKYNTWYVSRNEIIKIIYNPKSESSYWGNLRKKYLKENIDINIYLNNIKLISKDHKKRIQKAFTLLTLTDFLILIGNEELLKFINNLEVDLNKLVLDKNLETIISNYLNIYNNKKELIDKIISIIINY